jgi:hypothetical protein
MTTADSALWTIEFPATTIGDAMYMCRQAAGTGGVPLAPTQAGRLGYEATGGWDMVHELEESLTARGETTYLTKNG